VADARIQQSAAQPTLDVNIDRTRAQYTGVTAADVTNSLVVNLASSSQVAPVYWLNEKNGVTYPIALQTPQYQIDTLPALQNLPINATGAPTTVLGGIADIRRTHSDAVVSQYDIASMVRSTRRSKGAIWARSPPTSARSSPRTTRTSRRARSSPWSARRRP
jgi:multidrug efflux pump subunit AcrB